MDSRQKPACRSTSPYALRSLKVISLPSRWKMGTGEWVVHAEKV